jgi:hypothetical protein
VERVQLLNSMVLLSGSARAVTGVHSQPTRAAPSRIVVAEILI